MAKEELAVNMAAFVGQYRDSGQTRKAFAASHDISEAKLTYWIKKLSQLTAKDRKSPLASGFVPLKLESSPLDTSDHLLIRLPSGVEIQIPL